ncbi:MAG: hypothetical protein Q3971_01355 [Moraxella sp.]|nr:hypothetical protein [Moraxella sp.]
MCQKLLNQSIIYQGETLFFTHFWVDSELCLWIDNAKQIKMPKMEFVGGYPNECCIFIKNLSDEECLSTTSLTGEAIFTT